MKKTTILLIFLVSCLFMMNVKAATDIEINIFAEDKASNKYIEIQNVPKNDYTFNKEKSKCDNGAKIVFNEETFKYKITATKKDICNLYFDVIKTEDKKPETSTNEPDDAKSESGNEINKNNTNKNDSTNQNVTKTDETEVSNPKTGVVFPTTILILIGVGIFIVYKSKKGRKLFKID